MLKSTTPERVINFIWLSVALSICWPLPASAGKPQIFVFKITQICSVFSAFMLLLPLLYSCYLHLDDIVIVSKCICLSIGVIQIITQTITSFIKQDCLQRVVEEMIFSVKQAKQYEREIFSNYIAKCNAFYGGSIAWIYMCAIVFVLGPAFLPDPFPTDAVYPFRVNYTPVNTIIYLHQSFLSLQCAAHMCVSSFGALLLWFTAARFECLTVEIQEISNVDMLIACVRKQLYLKRYAEDVINSFRTVVLTAIGMSTFSLTIGGITLVMNAPLIVKVQFTAVCFTILVEIYMYSWPADCVKDMSINVSRSAYNLTWYEQTLEMQKNILYILLHQDPVTLSVTGVMPELTLHYYCSYLSNAFSIFAAMRVVFEDDST